MHEPHDRSNSPSFLHIPNACDCLSKLALCKLRDALYPCMRHLPAAKKGGKKHFALRARSTRPIFMSRPVQTDSPRSSRGCLLVENPREESERERIRSLCPSVCHRGISKTFPCQFIRAIVAVIPRSKEYSDGDRNEWTTPRLFLLRDALDYCRETMTREVKIARRGNGLRGRRNRSRKDCDSFDGLPIDRGTSGQRLN